MATIVENYFSRSGSSPRKRSKKRASAPAKAKATKSSTSKTTYSKRVTKSSGLAAAAAVVGGGILVYLLWPKTASASTVTYLPGGPGAPGGQGGQGGPGGGVYVPPPVQPLPQGAPMPSYSPVRPGQEMVTSGPGVITAPSGLFLRQAPDRGAPSIRLLAPGTRVQVEASNGAGWLRLAEGGWVCSTCAEAPPTQANVAAGQFPPWVRPA